MKMTKQKKKRLWILIAAGVLLVGAAVAAVVLLLPGQAQPKRTLVDISAYDAGSSPMYTVQGGLTENLAPLPRYGLTGVPEGYTQIRNSAQTANRFSVTYQDAFLSQEENRVQLSQQTAGEGVTVPFLDQVQTVDFGDIQVLYSAGTGFSSAAWIYGDTLFQLTADPIPLSLEETLAFVNLVDYSAAAEPEVRSLEFVEGGVILLGSGTTHLPWMVGGNPQLPGQIEYYSFPQAPEGYIETQPIGSVISPLDNFPADHPAVAGITDGPEEERMEAYQNEEGEVLTLANRMVGTGNDYIFSTVNDVYLGSSNPDGSSVEGGESRIQTVTVNGMEGRLYSGADASQLVLLGDYLFLEFTYQGSISPEEFLALAALVER